LKTKKSKIGKDDGRKFEINCRANFFRKDTVSTYLSLIHYSRPDNHIKGTPKHTMGMNPMICLGKKFNPTQEVPYETIIRGFRSAWQQQFDGNY
jgi:hypothetical protein